MHFSGGGHHNIICTEPIQSARYQSATARIAASRINARVWLHKHTLCAKCKNRRSGGVCWERAGLVLTPERKTRLRIERKDKSKSGGDSVRQLPHSHWGFYFFSKKTINVHHICERKLTSCFADLHQRELEARSVRCGTSGRIKKSELSKKGKKYSAVIISAVKNPPRAH